ncbi:hypothetical protein FRC19_000392 [Serendipita sp. 401]|nr:hypothetical protein FRC19_000392 [Serendipita sp. 401]
MSSIQKWQETKDADLTVELVAEMLEDISDDLWVTAACAERMVDSPEVSQVLVKTGLSRSSRLLEPTKRSIASHKPTEDADQSTEQNLIAYFQNHERERRLCILRQILSERLDRIQTYLLMRNAWQSSDLDEEPGNEEDEDPWADPDEENEPSEVQMAPFTLSDFLSQPLVDSAIILASERRFQALNHLLSYHEKALFPYRFSIINSIPLHVHPSEYHHLLPANDYDSNMEVRPERKPWREQVDWVEEPEVLAALHSTMTPEETTWLEDVDSTQDDEFPRIRCDDLLPSDELTKWYVTRVESIDSQSGLMDVALALLQHGASHGVPKLDEIGEDLLLLDRLIYEAPQPENPSLQIDWTLRRWRSLDPPEVIRAYLRHSDFESVASDIRRLVLPYLSVLESQAERNKRPDLELSNCLLYQYILSAPLELVVAIFESSKADIQRSYRIIRSDEDVARIALAYLYGLPTISDWPMMSRIFECQPDWGDDRDDDEKAYATLSSLAAVVAPSASRPRASAEELFIFFKPLPASALSRLLDVLDTHLEGGEILAKWSVSTSLQWFILSREDAGQQRAKAVRMSRLLDHRGKELESEEEWRSLLEDMLKLVTHAGGSKSTFGHLSQEEVSKIFFTGLLSSGNLAVAKRIKGRGRAAQYLTESVVEQICLDVSREIYDNATSGNMYRGEMKQAYECLSVAAPTARIQAERAFIEATSKICSFSVFTRPGIPITPLEIRLTKNRLDLIARVLSSTDDAYKHQEVILDLADKLGFKNDAAAEVKILSMLVEVALQHEDFSRAEMTCEKMIIGARKLRALHHTTTETNDDTQTSAPQEALEVAWRSCYQLGKQSEFHDTNRKLRLLGFALELCPAANTLDILTVWRKIEAEDIETRKQRSIARAAARPTGKRKEAEQTNYLLQARAGAVAAGSLLQGLKGLSQGQDAASHMFNRVTANLPFSIGNVAGVGRRSSEERKNERAGNERDFGQLFARQFAGSSSPQHKIREEVAAGARNALARGVGWLIGGDEDE